MQGLRDKPKWKVMPKLCAWLAGMLAGRRGYATAPKRELKEEAHGSMVPIAGRLAGMLLKTKSVSQWQELGWKRPRRGWVERHPAQHAQDLQRSIRNGLHIRVL